jgi:hypothetical protein
MLDLFVPDMVVAWDMSPLLTRSPGETVEFMGIAPGPPRLEAALKFSIPVMCILSVPGVGATICPFTPLFTDPLLPKEMTASKTYLKNWIRGLQYAFAELEFVPYMSRYKKRSLDLQNRFVSGCSLLRQAE